MIKVLLVDDSATSQLNIRQILDQDSEIQVVASVFNGEEALDATRRGGIDVVVMDISMPKMNGIDATRHIMANHPLPVVLCSATASDPQTIDAALGSGALSILEKPPGPLHPGREQAAARLIQYVKQAAQTTVSRRPLARLNHPLTAPSNLKNSGTETEFSGRIPASALTNILPSRAVHGEHVVQAERGSVQQPGVRGEGASQIEIVAIGASTGGPPVLQTLFEALTPDFPIPILVVQHIATGFLPGLVTWLRASVEIPIHIAASGQIPLPGHIYFAPDEHHLGMNAARRLILSDAPPDAGLRPSVAWLFRSVAQVYGAHALGFLLSGMGRDGAIELGLMRAAGAETWAQSQESSTVHGMPGEAIRLNAAAYIASPEHMVERLRALKTLL
ncbi:two-component system, chemotaxis family, response regulator CheB [Abditibacterium utsteinense]|uniref:protein-glutamate methylesterase n=1 Tax=Abditibacterium utsteinense TaxID=1960156 RepID=A0A2S8STU1_9BACT|nr:chemotaxis protein CheB [Abditibacterium utsteinense]PQV64210.1 two-component system, chemotaxis family, response regulator CheB [Abditibacterium utsteinense]